MRSALKNFLKILLFFSPTILFVSYNLYVTYTPIGATKLYTLSTSTNELMTTGGMVLLNGDQIKLDGLGGFRVSEPVFFEFSRLPRIDDGTTITTTFDHDAAQELYVSFFRTDRYDDPQVKEEYTWYPITFPNYDKLTTIADGSVYVHKNAVLKTLEYPQTEDMATLLKTYASNRSTLGTYPGITIPLKDFVQTPQPSATTSTTIPWQLRGDFGLYTYVPGNTLTFSFTKKDLNSYIGEDEYSLEVYRHNMLIYTKKFADDGITDYGVTEEVQNFNVSIENLEPDVYHLKFISSRTNNERLITSDTSIKDMVINSPYVVTDEQTALFLQPAIAYTQKNSANIAYVNESRDLYIYPKDHDKPYDNGVLHIVPNDDGFYTLVLDGEKLLYGMFSPTKESYFEPYSIILSNFSPDFWIVPQDLVFNAKELTPYIKKGTLGVGLRESFPIVNSTQTPYTIQSATFTFTTESLLK